MSTQDTDWNQLSRDVAREIGCDHEDGFSQNGLHPWIVAVVRIATLRERDAWRDENARLRRGLTAARDVFIGRGDVGYAKACDEFLQRCKVAGSAE